MDIYRCLVNLISNALDACPLSEGAVCVSTNRTRESELCVSVSDNGGGIDEAAKAAIFELFQTSKPGKGAGIGLPTVAAIVNKYNGRVEIDTKLGHGTTFRIFFREDVAVV